MITLKYLVILAVGLLSISCGRPETKSNARDITGSAITEQPAQPSSSQGVTNLELEDLNAIPKASALEQLRVLVPPRWNSMSRAQAGRARTSVLQFGLAQDDADLQAASLFALSNDWTIGQACSEDAEFRKNLSALIELANKSRSETRRSFELMETKNGYFLSSSLHVTD